VNCEGEYLDWPGRIFAIHWIPFYLQLLYYCFIFAIAIYFRNDSPFKSRSLAPFICIILQAINLTAERVSFVMEFEWNAYYDCFITSYLRYSTTGIT
jgi:hypothetical protein